MNTSDNYLHLLKWYYIGRQDDREHGPYSSSDMITWLQGGYFQPNENLMLRTDQDTMFKTLSEWIQICNNQIPFMLPVISYEQTIESLNNPNIQPCGPPFPYAPPVSGYYSQSGTPSSPPTPNDNQQHQFIRPPPSGPTYGLGQIQPASMMLMNGPPPQLPPPPPQSGMINKPVQPIYSPPSNPPTSFSSMPVSSVPSNHMAYPLQMPRNGSAPLQLPPPPFPFSMAPHYPPPKPPINLTIQQRQQLMAGINIEQQQAVNGASDSPDSGHDVTPYQHHDRKMDTTDAPWNKEVKKAMVDAETQTTEAIQPANQHSIHTQTNDLELSITDIQKLISKLCGIRVVMKE